MHVGLDYLVFWGKVQWVCATCVSECTCECVSSMSRRLQVTSVCVCGWECVRASCASVESEGDQTVSQLP